MKRYLYAILVLLAGCVSDPSEMGQGSGGNKKATGEEAEIILRLHVPGDVVSAPTRALTYAKERDVSNIWVLVFDKGSILREVKEAHNLSTQDPQSMTTYTFSVILSPTAVGESTKLVLLSNIDAASDVPQLNSAVGSGYDDVMKLVTRNVTGKMFASAPDPANPTDPANPGVIPMWGETGFLSISAGMSEQEVELLRSIARIDVGVGQMSPASSGEYSETDANLYVWDGLDPNGDAIPFVLESVYVIRPNNAYRVAPASANMSTNTETTPSLPASVGRFDVAQSESLFAYSDSDIRLGLYTARSIYVPSADIKQIGINSGTGKSGDANHLNRMAVVVGGRYNGRATTYYRMDFTADGKELDDVLRNHLYSFSIQGVKGNGYSTVDEAYKAASTNMIVSVLEWNESPMRNIYFDGTYYFAVDKQRFEFNAISDPNVLEMNIRTNINDHFEFMLDNASGAKLVWDEDPAKQRLTFTGSNDEFRYTLVKNGSIGDEGSYTLRIEALSLNIGSSAVARMRDWTIVAKRLAVPFTVTQEYDTDGWESFEDGQHEFVMPEGATMGNLPFIMITAESAPVITIVDDMTHQEVQWLRISGVVEDISGLWKYNGGVIVNPYKLTINDPPVRSATITIEWSNINKRLTYRVTQEAPYIRIEREQIYVHRPSMSTYVTPTVTVFTNIMLNDLDLIHDKYCEHEHVIGETELVYYDTRNPRYLQFTPEIDFTYTGTFSCPFRVSPKDDDKYGNLVDETVSFLVPPTNASFKLYWLSTKTNDDITYTFPNGTQIVSTNWVVPWNMTEVELFVDTNVGAEEDPVNSLKGNSILEHYQTSDHIELVDGTSGDRYFYKFTLNKAHYLTEDEYTLGFRSTLTDVTTLGSPIYAMQSTARLRHGPQRIKRDSLLLENNGVRVSYEGFSQGTPMRTSIKSNVNWSATSDASWLTMKLDNGSWLSATMLVNNRYNEPKTFPNYGEYENFSTLTDFSISVEPLGLNSTPDSRTGVISFVNEDYSQTMSGAPAPKPVTVTQWGLILRTNGSTLPVGDIPGTGGSYNMYSITNQTEWVVKAYDVTNGEANKVLLRTHYYTGNSLNAMSGGVNSTISINIPSNPGATPRQVQFVLSLPNSIVTASDEISSELLFGVWTQEAGNVIGTPSPNGVHAPPGTIGITLSGKMTLRGSQVYSGSQIEAASPFGTVESEDAFLAYFKWGGTVAIDSDTSTNDIFDVGDIVWAPEEFKANTGSDGLTEMFRKITTETASSSNSDLFDFVPNAGQGYTYPESVNSTADLSRGLGDPCLLADKGISKVTWRTPAYTTENAVTMFGGYSTVNGPAAATDGSFSGYVMVANDYSTWMPRSSWRNYDNGQTQGQSNSGYGIFWSRNISNSLNANDGPTTHARYLGFMTGLTVSVGNYKSGYAVRCFTEEEEEEELPAGTVNLPSTLGVPAPPGIIGMSESGILTLRGSSHYKNTSVETDSEFGPLSTEKVYIVFWKWNSLIGTSSDNSVAGAAFDENDIIFAPQRYIDSGNYLALKTSIQYASSTNKWGLIPYTNNASLNTWVSHSTTSESNGIGDPCKLAELDKGSKSAYTYNVPTGSTSGLWNGKGLNGTYDGAKIISLAENWGADNVNKIHVFKNSTSNWSETYVLSGFRDSGDSGKIIMTYGRYRSRTNSPGVIALSLVAPSDMSQNISSLSVTTVTAQNGGAIRCVRE